MCYVSVGTPGTPLIEYFRHRGMELLEEYLTKPVHHMTRRLDYALLEFDKFKVKVVGTRKSGGLKQKLMLSEQLASMLPCGDEDITRTEFITMVVS